jgi:hypothetical protein
LAWTEKLTVRPELEKDPPEMYVLDQVCDIREVIFTDPDPTFAYHAWIVP